MTQARLERFIERMGMAFEAEGATRIMGRIFGFLLMSPVPRALDEIARELGVSRASVSTEARKLAQLGLLERHTIVGDRRDYYALHPDGFRSSLEARIANLRAFAGLIGESRELAGDEPTLGRRINKWEQAHFGLLDAFERLWRELPAGHADNAELPPRRSD